MNLDFNVEKLQQIADDFYYATGIGIFIIGTDFTDVKVKSTRWNPYCAVIRSTDEGRERCVASDDELFRKCSESKKPEIHICHGGLINIAAPIMYEGSIVGYVFFSSLRQGDFSSAIKCASDLLTDTEQMKEYYRNVPVYDERRFKSVINLAVILAEHVILAQMIKPTADENLQRVKNYIKDNLSSDLSITNISKGTNISKSVLYRLISKYFGCTVSEYVNSKRADMAAKLLADTSLSVLEISEKSGFTSVVHFRNTFKRYKGLTPLNYRKQQTENKAKERESGGKIDEK